MPNWGNAMTTSTLRENAMSIYQTNGRDYNQNAQNFKYSDYFENPAQKGVGSGGSFGQVKKNIDALIEYNELLISGPAMGNNYFIDSNVKCNNESTRECKGKNKYEFVRNVPNGHMPCNLNLGLSDLGFPDLKGLVPGMMEDIADTNPMGIVNQLVMSSDAEKEYNKCEKVRKKVGRYGENTDAQWVWACANKDTGKAWCITGRDSFVDYTGDGKLETTSLDAGRSKLVDTTVNIGELNAKPDASILDEARSMTMVGGVLDIQDWKKMFALMLMLVLVILILF
jgi:hypothetical protein